MKIARLLAGVLALNVIGTAWAAKAETIGYADAYDRIATSCGGDIEKYCSGVPLAGGGVKDCLAKNQAKVSGQCKATMAETLRLLELRATAQATALKVCDRDVGQWCKGVVATDGYQLQCMLRVKNRISAKCNQVITDAGWR